MNILEIRELYKSFGTNEILKGLTLSVPEHSIFGFIGPNGAGKTTTMKIVLGLLKPEDGTVTVCGEKVRYGETKTNRHIGYLPDVPEYYSYMKPMEYLKLCGEISGLSKSKTRERSEELLSMVGLTGINRKIGGFSRGMKQRLGIAQALLNEPKLLICDEPTSALDPMGRKEILDILLTIKGKTTIVFSTHVLSDVERICDYVAVLHEGKAALCGTLGEMKRRRKHEVFTIDFMSDQEASAFAANIELNTAGASLKRVDSTANIESRSPVLQCIQDKHTLTLTVSDIKSGGRFLIRLLEKNEITPARFEMMEPTLESLYLEVVQ